MDENRNPFDFEQPNSNSDERKSKGSHTRSVNQCPQQGAHDQSENAYFQSGKGYTNPETESQKGSSDTRRINGTLSYQGEFSQNRSVWAASSI